MILRFVFAPPRILFAIFFFSNYTFACTYITNSKCASVGRLKYLTLTEANRVWMPDLFFSNEKEGHFHNIIMPNVYIRIFPYGSVLYSIRISLTLACPMNLKLYPLDRQVCSLRMASCKYHIHRIAHKIGGILNKKKNNFENFCRYL